MGSHSSHKGSFKNLILIPIELMWQSRKLRRVVKSAMAAETLVQVDVAEADFWLAKLLNEIFYDSSATAPQIKIECLHIVISCMMLCFQ